MSLRCTASFTFLRNSMSKRSLESCGVSSSMSTHIPRLADLAPSSRPLCIKLEHKIDSTALPGSRAAGPDLQGWILFAACYVVSMVAEGSSRWSSARFWGMVCTASRSLNPITRVRARARPTRMRDLLAVRHGRFRDGR